MTTLYKPVLIESAEQAEALYPGPKRYAIRRAAEQLVRHIEKETA